MKILVYSSAATFGGHELVSLKGVEALLESGHDLDIVCSSANGRLVEAARALAECHPVRCRLHLRRYRMRSLQIVRTWTSPWLVFALFRLVRALRPDRVLALQGDIEQGSEIVLPARLAGVPIVSYVPMVMGGRERAIRLAGLRDALSRPLYRLVMRFVVIAEFFQAQAMARGARQVRVVSNCVDEAFLGQPVRRAAMRAALGIRDDECLSGFVGRISYQQKGIDRLVNLVDRQRAHFRANRLLVVGSGPDLPRLEADLCERRIDDCVLLRPWDDDRVAYFDAMDVFLCTSRFEGVPLTILEALSRGVPVVSVALPALVGQLPLTFCRGQFDLDEFWSLLASLGPRAACDGASPQPSVAGLRRAEFDEAFVEAVVS
ncbi:MAG: glycosyltransferase [Burkholderiaceae bacterium]